MSDDLVAFLRARLDEDQVAAEAAPEGPWHVRPGDGPDLWTVVGPFAAYSRFNALTETRETTAFREEVAGSDIGAGGVRSGDAAAHIARHDPARVLREVEAKRAVVDAYAEVVEMDTDDAEPEFAYGRAAGLGVAVRLLALPYADHPDYREEWRP